MFDSGGNAYSRFDDPSKHLNYYNVRGSALENDENENDHDMHTSGSGSGSGIFDMTAPPTGTGNKTNETNISSNQGMNINNINSMNSNSKNGSVGFALEDSLDTFSSSFKSPKEHHNTSNQQLYNTNNTANNNVNNTTNGLSAFSIDTMIDSQLNTNSNGFGYNNRDMGIGIDMGMGGRSRNMQLDKSLLYSKKYDVCNVFCIM